MKKAEENVFYKPLAKIDITSFWLTILDKNMARTNRQGELIF
jgi:hypothetical protein